MTDDKALIALVSNLYRSRYFRQRPKPTLQLLETLRLGLHANPARVGLVFLWGVHGKTGVGDDDLKAMAYLKQFLDYLSVQFAAVINMTIIVCDTHAAVNRAPDTYREQYAGGIEAEATHYDWATQRMSGLWQQHGITMEAVAAEALKIDVESSAPRLVEFAHRYYKGRDAVEGARRYLAARLLEKPVIADAFKDCIHVTPVEPSLYFLQPNLPEFHVWLTKRGCSVKPWFPRETS